jgi:hypothetical protein
MYRPSTYASVFGHIGQSAGKNIIDATHVRKVTNAHEMFHHMLQVFVEHLFLICQVQSAIGGTHEKDESENSNSHSLQRQWME